MTESGKINSKLLGLITFRDIDFLSKDQWSTIPVSQVMTPAEELITAKNDLTLKDAYHILQRSKKGLKKNQQFASLNISRIEFSRKITNC